MEWKPISGYESLYEISDKGNIRSVRSGRELKVRPNSDGYLIVSLFKKGKRVTTTVAKLVGLQFVSGFSKNRNQISYIDGDRKNLDHKNLQWTSNFPNNKNDVMRDFSKSTRIKATNETTGEVNIFENMGDASAFLGEKPYFVRDKMRRKTKRESVNGHTLERI